MKLKAFIPELGTLLKTIGILTTAPASAFVLPTSNCISDPILI